MEGLWHEVSDEDLPSDGGTTSPQGRADGTGEHYARDLKRKNDRADGDCGEEGSDEG